MDIVITQRVAREHINGRCWQIIAPHPPVRIGESITFRVMDEDGLYTGTIFKRKINRITIPSIKIEKGFRIATLGSIQFIS